MVAHALLRDVSRPAPSASSAAEAFEALFVPAPGQDRRAVADMLRRAEVRTAQAPDLSAASQLAADHPFEWALIDLADEAHALAGIRLIRARQPRLRLAALVDDAGAVTAGQARLAGVTDLLPWPSHDIDLAAFVADIRDRVARADGPATARPAVIVACSPAMQDVMRLVRGAAGREGGVVFHGQPGSGRRLLARTLHDHDGPSPRPFVVVDGAHGAAREIDALLFGDADRASARGAARALVRLDRASAVYAARGGTLCVAHISRLTPRAQARLARVLRAGEARLDDGDRIDVHVRLVATDADEDGDECRLRPELQDLLGGARIAVPPLRRRRQDIPMLAAQLLREARPDIGPAVAGISRSALLVLAAMSWPGNGPELRDAIRRLARSASGPVIQIEDVLALTALESAVAPAVTGTSLRAAKATFERECISRVIVRHRGRMGEAAKALGIQRTNLYRKVRQLNIERSLLATRK